MATKIFLAPGLLARIRKSVIEGVQPDELAGRDSRLNELVQHHYISTKARLWGGGLEL
jgi:hypothetical protein